MDSIEGSGGLRKVKTELKTKIKTGCFIAAKGHFSVYGVKPRNTFCGFSYLDFFFFSSGKLAILFTKNQRHLEFSKV